MPKANSGAKYDQGRINQVLALIIDISDHDLGILINRLREEQARRNINMGRDPNTDTIQT